MEKKGLVDLEDSEVTVMTTVAVLRNCLSGTRGVGGVLPSNFCFSKREWFLQLLLDAGVLRNGCQVRWRDDRKKIYMVTEKGHAFLEKWLEWSLMRKGIKKDMRFLFIKDPKRYGLYGELAELLPDAM